MEQPVKIIETDSGVLLLYTVKPSLIADPSIDLNIIDGELVLLVDEKYSIPIKYIDIENNQFFRVYLLGADHTDFKAEVFAVIDIDARTAGKIVAYKEIVESGMLKLPP